MDVQDSGSLDQKAFLTLLVELHQGNATGSLKLERAPLQKAVYFRDGQILFAASNDPQDQLASILVDEGKLSKDQMQVAQARVSAGNPLAKVLTELGYISQRELADAARLKVEKILTDLYQWNDGSYQFVERSLPKGAIDLELSTPRLLFNSIRRVQEREWVLEQLGSLDSVLSATPSLERFLSDTKPDPSAGEVLRLVDGVKSIKQIGAVSALGEFEVCKILAAALRIGAVEKLETAGVAAPKPRAASPSARGPASARLPFSEGSVAETTALHIGEGIASPNAMDEDDELPLRPVPLSEAEKRAPRPSRPAADFVFDEPPVAASSEERRVPRPRKMRRGGGGGGGGGKKFLVAALALVLLGGGAGAAYYFLWPRGPSAGSTVSPSTPTNTRPITDRSPTTDAEAPDSEGTGNAGTGAATGTPPSTTAPPTTATAPPGPTPTSPSDPPLPTAGQQRPVTAGTAPPPTATSPSPRPTPPPSPPPTTPPTRPTTRPSTSSQPLAQGQQQLRAGDYAQAAAIFLSHLRGVGADKFTIAVGVFCDTGNLERVVNSSGGREELLVLAFDNGGRSCYRVFWGIFDSREEAQRALGSVPAGVRARDSAPVPIERLIP